MILLRNSSYNSFFERIAILGWDAPREVTLPADRGGQCRRTGNCGSQITGKSSEIPQRGMKSDKEQPRESKSAREGREREGADSRRWWLESGGRVVVIIRRNKKRSELTGGEGGRKGGWGMSKLKKNLFESRPRSD